MIKFTIPINPVTKKNSMRIAINSRTGKPFLLQSKNYVEYEEMALWYIPKGKRIDFAVNVECHFYMQTKRKVDLTNLLAAIDDVMVKAGLLEDDNFTIIQSHDGSRVLYSKESPRTEVCITKAADANNN